MQVDIEEYLNGRRLIGDDYNLEELQAWWRDEENAYASMVSDRDDYVYEYHALNSLLGFEKLEAPRFQHVLGLGSAYGEELKPVLPRAERITIVDPGDSFQATELDGVPVTYVKSAVSGDIALPDATVDLATSFGCLHHIANVTHVVGEIGRVLQPGGHFLVREPVTNMGDWRNPRRGLTNRERGIPVHIMTKAFAKAGLDVVEQTPTYFPPFHHLVNAVYKEPVYLSRTLTRIDVMLGRLFEGNTHYNRNSALKKLGPACRFWILRKV